MSQPLKSRASAAPVLLVMTLVATTARGAANPRGKATARVGRATVEIEYGRPSLRGRDVLDLIEPGQLWRLGADAPTTLRSEVALQFGAKVIPKGKYILLIRYLGPGLWSMVVSKRPAGDYDPASQVAEVLMRIEKRPTITEQLTIQIDSQTSEGSINIAWGHYLLIAHFSPALH